ncbi:hypothetical protein ACUYGN_14440 [Enterobacter chengduensis]
MLQLVVYSAALTFVVALAPFNNEENK